MYLFFLVFLLSSCINLQSSVKSVKVEITSDVPASIFLTSSLGTKETLGKTPLKFSLKPFSDGGKWLHLEVSSPGYVPENIMLPAETTTDQTVSLKLKPIEWWNDPKEEVSSQVINQIGYELQQIYRKIRQNDQESSLVGVEKLIAHYPFAAILYDIKGSIYILKGQKDLALASYERSLQLSGDNPEILKIINDLKKERD